MNSTFEVGEHYKNSLGRIAEILDTQTDYAGRRVVAYRYLDSEMIHTREPRHCVGWTREADGAPSPHESD